MRTYFSIILIFMSLEVMSQQRGVQNIESRDSKKVEKSRTILDDSTKTIYGMNTSKYMSKDNFLLGISYIKREKLTFENPVVSFWDTLLEI